MAAGEIEYTGPGYASTKGRNCGRLSHWHVLKTIANSNPGPFSRLNTALNSHIAGGLCMLSLNRLVRLRNTRPLTNSFHPTESHLSIHKEEAKDYEADLQ